MYGIEVEAEPASSPASSTPAAPPVAPAPEPSKVELKKSAGSLHSGKRAAAIMSLIEVVQ